MRYTKAQLTTAMYLLLDEVLPTIECSKIQREGNINCDRCDECMMEQYLKRAKAGEKCKKEIEYERRLPNLQRPN